MAAQKKVEDIDPIDKYKALNDKVSKLLGKGNYHPPKEGIENNIEWILTDVPTIDYVFGGGIPKGYLIALEGKSGAGKTTLAQHFLKVAAEKTGLPSAWIDAEHRVNIDWMERSGVNTKELALAIPNTAEGALSVLREMVSGESALFGLVVLDSISALIPEAATQGEVGEGQSPHLKRAKLLNDMLPQILAGMERTKTTVVIINQVRANITGYGKDTPTGGASVLYMPSLRLSMSRKETTESPYIGIQGSTNSALSDTATGIISGIKVEKSSVGHPFRKGELPISFLNGVDILSDIIQWAIKLGVVERGGAYLYYPSKANPIVNGNGLPAFTKNVIAKSLLPQIKEEVYKRLDLEGERYREIE